MANKSPDYLTKFCSLETAEWILDTRCLRWSSPHLFNDPLELSHVSRLSFDNQTLLQQLIQSASAMIFARDTPRGHSPLLNAIRRWREEERFASPDEAEGVLGELLGQIVENREAQQQEIMQEWRKYASSLRICTFSHRNDSLINWRSYGDNHRGVALRFDATVESRFSQARQVKYSQRPVEIITLREELDAVINNIQRDPKDQFQEKFLGKPDEFSSEQEWRCFHQVANFDQQAPLPPDNEWYENLRFDTQSLSSVYFGMAAPKNACQELQAFIKKRYPRVRIFQGCWSSAKNVIEFNRVS